MKSQVMDNVRNLGYVSGNIAVEKASKQDSSDRMTRPRQSVFDITPISTGSLSTGALPRTRQPISSDHTAGSRRPLANNRSASS